MQGTRVIPDNIQPATFVRTVWTEGRDDDMTATLNRMRYLTNIGSPVICIRQEVKYGPIMPDVIASGL